MEELLAEEEPAQVVSVVVHLVVGVGSDRSLLHFLPILASLLTDYDLSDAVLGTVAILDHPQDVANGLDFLFGGGFEFLHALPAVDSSESLLFGVGDFLVVSRLGLLTAHHTNLITIESAYSTLCYWLLLRI